MTLQHTNTPSGGTSPGHGLAPRGGLRVWQGLLLASLCAIAAVCVHLMWQLKAPPLIDMQQWLGYATLLALAGAAPLGFTWAQRRWSRSEPNAVVAHRPVWLSPVAAVAVLLVGLTALALVTQRLANDTVLRSVGHRLQAVSTLKATLIGAWMESETGDIRVWTGSPEFAKHLAEWRHGGMHEPVSRQHLIEYLNRISKTGHYTEIGLRDAATGELLLSTTGDADTASVRNAAVAAASAALPLLEDFHSDAEAHNEVFYLGFFSAIPGEGRGLVVHVGLDPEHELFPLIEQWPGDTDTAEALLLRREADSMLVVNDSRRGRPTRHISTRTPGSIGTAMARGDTGLLRGTDDRGKKVLAFVRPVEGTSWLLAAKLDDAEAFAELNHIVALTTAVAAALLLLGAWRWVETRRLSALERQVQLEREDHARRLSEVSRRVVSAQEEERRRLAVELHDRTGGNLAAIDLNLKSIEKLVQPPGQGEHDVLRDTRDLLADTIVSIREFCGDLRPAVLDHAGLAHALKVCVVQFAQRTGVTAHFDDQCFSGRLAPDVEAVLYRISQEALLNCAKHAQARHVHVTLARTGNHVSLMINDDGVGFNPAPAGSGAIPSGSGLLNMRERAAFMGGSLLIESAPGQGTRITVRVG